MTKRKGIAGVVAVAMILGSILLFAGPSSATKATNTITNIPVHGTWGSNGGYFKGQESIKRFKDRNGQIKAVAKLSGTFYRQDGSVKKQLDPTKVRQPVTLQDSSTCQILNLVLGPLDLDLLGLHVHLNRVHLTITAEAGPGNLLGNLLCAVAHLLDNTGVTGPITHILNAIKEVFRLNL